MMRPPPTSEIDEAGDGPSAIWSAAIVIVLPPLLLMAALLLNRRFRPFATRRMVAAPAETSLLTVRLPDSVWMLMAPSLVVTPTMPSTVPMVRSPALTKVKDE